jgi:urate oxidase
MAFWKTHSMIRDKWPAASFDDMNVRLGANQYGKAETHLVRVYHEGEVHALRDLTVSVALSGDFEAVHVSGDNASVLATDTQKNTVYAFAKEAPIGEPEAFALRLGRHFLGGAVTRARVEVTEAPWTRIGAHAFTQSARELRFAAAVCEAEASWLVSGLSDLVVLKTTDSEFHGFPRDRYTTLQETSDRVLATAVSARWRHPGDASFADARAALVETFAGHHSLSLQQTLYAMGSAVLDTCPTVAEIRLSMPNKHHFVVDLSPFGLSNENEVFHADDRPYGLIEGAVVRDGAPDPGPVWDPYPLVSPT